MNDNKNDNISGVESEILGILTKTNSVSDISKRLNKHKSNVSRIVSVDLEDYR